jgi:2-polyprenyl-3-methyl-5-hydroxy-6-metoxy-1,4-benzoquinol methylase
MGADIRELRRLYGGFQAARVILTANNLGVFARLARKPLSARAAASALKADPRGTELLLNALVSIGLLAVADGVYANAEIAALYLDPASPAYQGNILRHIETLWQNWSALDEVVKTGRPARRAFDHRAFIMGMHDLSRPKVKKVLGKIGLKGVRTALDVGGGPGTYCIEMARLGIRPTLFDLPETVKIARAVAKKEGASGITFRGGDYHTDGLGKGFDLVLVSQILHSNTEQQNVALLTKCRAATAPGGQIAIQEFPLDEGRTSPPQGALFAINMLVATEGGRTYTPGEISAWLGAAGYARVAVRPGEDSVLVTGRAGAGPRPPAAR